MLLARLRYQMYVRANNLIVVRCVSVCVCCFVYCSFRMIVVAKWHVDALCDTCISMMPLIVLPLTVCHMLLALHIGTRRSSLAYNFLLWWYNRNMNMVATNWCGFQSWNKRKKEREIRLKIENNFNISSMVLLNTVNNHNARFLRIGQLNLDAKLSELYVIDASKMFETFWIHSLFCILHWFYIYSSKRPNWLRLVNAPNPFTNITSFCLWIDIHYWFCPCLHD